MATSRKKVATPEVKSEEVPVGAQEEPTQEALFEVEASDNNTPAPAESDTPVEVEASSDEDRPITQEELNFLESEVVQEPAKVLTPEEVPVIEAELLKSEPESAEQAVSDNIQWQDNYPTPESNYQPNTFSALF